MYLLEPCVKIGHITTLPDIALLTNSFCESSILFYYLIRILKLPKIHISATSKDILCFPMNLWTHTEISSLKYPKRIWSSSPHPLILSGWIFIRGKLVKTDENGLAERVSCPAGHPLTAIDWDIIPSSIYWGTKFYYDQYRLPIHITENRMSAHDCISPASNHIY